MSIEINSASDLNYDVYKDSVPHFVRMTGPESYDYQFRTYPPLAAFLRQCWVESGNIYSHDAAMLALEGQDLVALSIAFPGSEYYPRYRSLRGVISTLIKRGESSQEEVAERGARVEHASYLNAHVPDDVYYLMTLATSESVRGKGLGRQLLEQRIQIAREGKYRSFHLDVLSNNPAVDFYRSFGFEVAAELIAPIPFKLGAIPMELRMKMDLR